MTDKPPASSTEWETPQWLFHELDAEFGFVIDAAATKENAKCDISFHATDGGVGTLHRDWEWNARNGKTKAIFLNPPYDRTIARWVRKALMESMRGATVVCVLPVRTSTRWWQNYVTRANEIRFLPRRVRFEYRGKPHGSPREDTAIVVFKGLAKPFNVQDDPE